MDFDPGSTLAQLRAENPVDRLVALRHLKNDIVGHLARKEQWTQHGVLTHIVAIVAPSSITRAADDDKSRLMGLQLLGSFANAGPAFIPALHAAGAIPAVLSSSCLGSAQPDITLWSLRVLRDIAASTSQSTSSSSFTVIDLAELVLATDALDTFSKILSHTSPSREIDAEVYIIAYLIKKLCQEERHQIALVNHGILDALGTRLASFVVAKGQVLPGTDDLLRGEGLAEFLPAAATSNASLEMVLWAISAIITDSPYRACKLLLSPSILAAFPVADSEALAYAGTTAEALELPGLRPTKQTDHDPMDYFLPYMPHQPRPHNFMPTNTPPSGPAAKDGQSAGGRNTSRFNPNLASWNTSGIEIYESGGELDAEEAESPLIPWLIGLIRTGHKGEILAAASVLSSLFKAGFAYKSREHLLSVLVVPVLVNILSETSAHTSFGIDTPFKTQYRLDQSEEGPAILTRLLTDSDILQKAAFECDAVKLISKILKSTYDMPLPDAEAQPWSPSDGMAIDSSNLDPSCRLEKEQGSRAMAHRVKLRENCLKALGAMASFKDEYRKVMVEQDILPYIVESLCAVPGDPRKAKERSRTSEKSTRPAKEPPISGRQTNPPSVLIAACYAIRMLSRSPHILRTSLTDSNVTVPIIQLLIYPGNVKVRIAAMDSICNLVLDFSPLREPLIDEGVVPIICEHAHHMNPTLKQNSLWALKHVVHAADVEFKKCCIRELGSEFLVQLVCDDTEDEALYHARGPADDTDDDIDMGVSDESHRRASQSESVYKTPPPLREAHSEIRILVLAESRLAALREAETNPARKARHDDLAIQEQALTLIRNLIANSQSGGNTDGVNDTATMIDYLFEIIGQDRLFEIMASKLRSKTTHVPNSRESSTGQARADSRVVPPHSKLIVAVIYILVHMAASIPRHRQLVIAQTELLKSLSKMFNSQNREVRLALCHLINNLTWQDDGTDASACSQRAVELRKLGFLSKLEQLGTGDEELDVRERAKSALWQMKHGY